MQRWGSVDDKALASCHLGCHSLWARQRLRRRELSLSNVAGETNPVDAFTKHAKSRVELDQAAGLFSCRFLEERAALAPASRSHHAAHIVEPGHALVTSAHDPAVLPHLHLREDIAELFQEAILDPPRREEDDLDPAK